MLQDYHIHVLAHGEYIYTCKWLGRYLRQARQLQLSEIGLVEHDEFRHLIDFAVVNQLRKEFPDIKIKVGLEIDYIPGRENEIRDITSEQDWDYLIGSVHFIDGWAFDHPDHKDRFLVDDIDEICFNYFDLVRQSVEANCFDVVGHLDLVKIWGDRPRRNTFLHYIQPILKSIKETGMAVEINTSGLRKPVGEMYPALTIIKQMKAMDIPILFGSDAHHPHQVGKDFDQAVLFARRAGYNEIVTFTHRKTNVVKI